MAMFGLSIGITEGRDYLSEKNPKELTKEEREGLEGLNKIYQALEELNPDMDPKMVVDTLAVQMTLVLIAAIFAIAYFCSDSTGARYRMMAATILTTVAYNLWYVNFPADTTKMVVDNLFNLYYIYVAWMWARQPTERKGQYN